MCMCFALLLLLTIKLLALILCQPFYSGTYIAGKNILAHERLAIVGVDSGAQPLVNVPLQCCGGLVSHTTAASSTSPSSSSSAAAASPSSSSSPSTESIVLCVNGEIYNHKELRTKYCPTTKFTTASDCEVITHLYEYFTSSTSAASTSTTESSVTVGSSSNGNSSNGTSSSSSSDDGIIQLLNSLNGIFAFVLVDESYDNGAGRYIIARDHIGIIPLYWGRDADGHLWVSSEMKALNDVCIAFEEFPPGYVYDSSTDTKVQWYTPAWWDETYMPPAIKSPTAMTEMLTALRTQLIDAVRRQLMSDVPYGVLLSGGLDSSLIASIAARICAKRVESNSSLDAWWPRLHSFSIGLTGSPDLAAAQKVATHIGSVHHSFVFTVEEGLNAYDDVIYHLETYDVTTVRAATPMYLMSRKIKAMGVKMVLSGEGADEIFGGYLYFWKAPNQIEMQKELVNKMKMLSKFDCLRANKSTMAWGVEARVPFLDRQFVDFAMDIDPAAKMPGKNGGGRIEKHILREAFVGFLPEEVLWRQKEQFSDGVGYSWIDSIKARAEQRVSDADMAGAAKRFPYNTPQTKEAYHIRTVFAKHFPGKSAEQTVPGGPSVACSTPAAIAWDASFQKFADQSGRSVAGVHAAAYDADTRAAAKGEQVKDGQAAAAAKASEYKSTIAGKTLNRSGSADVKKKQQPQQSQQQQHPLTNGNSH